MWKLETGKGKEESSLECLEWQKYVTMKMIKANIENLKHSKIKNK